MINFIFRNKKKQITVHTLNNNNYQKYLKDYHMLRTIIIDIE